MGVEKRWDEVFGGEDIHEIHGTETKVCNMAGGSKADPVVNSGAVGDIEGDG